MKIAISQLLKGKCHKCHKGDIYEKRGSLLRLRMPRMNKKCPVCQHTFEKEPGYFYGAMYVSYMLTVAEAIAIYFICSFFFEKAIDLRIFLIIAFSMVALSFFNMRASRIIWIHLFKA
ncbi:DUF983 domain-containing protein [Leptobacterium flavescens]|uniref:DUF983 domain-containing protein n=1 Tax=Leptobacterium flavescens TaxID=472055 RepID=A0A6P0UUZ2_9FLAO|nr:DUF983 domain-containing protein [Leptobacterium flavescens]NER14226.1 DUF983 domain-containing protein [Leptobacterium flavescens]